MKYLILFVTLILVGCKNKIPATPQQNASVEAVVPAESDLHPTVYQLWDDFIEANPQYKDEALPNSDFFHNNKKDADRLADLTRLGKKQASSGLYRLYQIYKVDLPQVGTKQIITNFEGEAQAIIETIQVDTLPFNQVSKTHAELDMGTFDQPLNKWKSAHWDFFEKALEQIGEKPSEQMLVVCEKFKTVWIDQQ